MRFLTRRVCVLIEEYRGRRRPLAVINKEDIEEAAEFLGCTIPQSQFYCGGINIRTDPLTDVEVRFSYKRISKNKKWVRSPNTSGIYFTFKRLDLFSGLDLEFHLSNKKIRFRHRLMLVAMFP